MCAYKAMSTVEALFHYIKVQGECFQRTSNMRRTSSNGQTTTKQSGDMHGGMVMVKFA